RPESVLKIGHEPTHRTTSPRCTVTSAGTGARRSAANALSFIFSVTRSLPRWPTMSGPLWHDCRRVGAGVMFSGNTLFPDLEAKRYSSGFFCLYYQGDGNLVLYQNSSSALWSTGATGGKAGCATMQSDGILSSTTATGCLCGQAARMDTLTRTSSCT